MDRQEHLWWHTVLAAVLMLILFVPCVLIAGILAWLYHVIEVGWTGRYGDGIGWIVRGMQYALATVASTYIGHVLFKKSHVLVSVTIFTTIIITVMILAVAFSIISKHETHDLFYWLEAAASLAGVAFGAITMAQSAQTEMPRYS